MSLKTRVIPVLLLRNDKLVQSRGFSRYNMIGDPWTSVKRLNAWSSDEIIYLDITRYDDDHAKSSRIQLLEHIAKNNRSPLAFGGGIRSAKEAGLILKSGADKVVVNNLIFESPSEVQTMVDDFGSQAIIASLDFKLIGGQFVPYRGGRQKADLSLEKLLNRVHNLGCGEILVNSIDNDGLGKGYDVPLIDRVSSFAEVPVIALGGVGHWSHFAQAMEETNVSAVAAANIFHHSENSMFRCKKYLRERGLNVRFSHALSNLESLI